MHAQKKAWLAINVVGGAAVLGSYVHGLATHPETRNALWGSMPDELKAVYGVTMWLAAGGYFLFSYYFLVRTEAATVRFGNRLGFGSVNTLYALVMVTSALWMPLTFAHLEKPSSVFWLAIRVDLLAAGAGSIGLVIGLFVMKPRAQGVAGVLALVGLLLFSLQTAFLDPLVWPQFF